MNPIASYSRGYGKSVVIRDEYRSFAIDVPNLKAAIESIEAERESFATEEAYQKRLAIYIGALDYARSVGLDTEA